MRKVGQYTRCLKDLSTYVAPHFLQYSKTPSWAECGCGHKAFYRLTGQSLDHRDACSDSVDDKIMVKHLRLLNYTVIPLSICAVTNHASLNNKIVENHVLLISQIMYRGEGSWAVLYRNKYYHSGYNNDLHPLEFLNRPILTAYIVYHPKWTVSKRKR